MTQVIAGIGTSQAASLELCRDSQLVVFFRITGVFCPTTALDCTQFKGSLFWGGNSNLVQEIHLRFSKRQVFVGNVLNLCTSKSTKIHEIPRFRDLLKDAWDQGPAPVSLASATVQVTSIRYF